MSKMLDSLLTFSTKASMKLNVNQLGRSSAWSRQGLEPSKWTGDAPTRYQGTVWLCTCKREEDCASEQTRCSTKQEYSQNIHDQVQGHTPLAPTSLWPTGTGLKKRHLPLLQGDSRLWLRALKAESRWDAGIWSFLVVIVGLDLMVDSWIWGSDKNWRGVRQAPNPHILSQIPGSWDWV